MLDFDMPRAARLRRGMDPDDARNLGVRAVGFVAKDRVRLHRFLSGAGITLPEFWRRPHASRHLTAALDFLITDETLLRDFSRVADIAVETVYDVRRVLMPRPLPAELGTTKV